MSQRANYHDKILIIYDFMLAQLKYSEYLRNFKSSNNN